MHLQRPTKIMCPVEMSIFDATGSSHQEDVDERPDAPTVDPSLDDEPEVFFFCLPLPDAPAEADADVDAVTPVEVRRSGLTVDAATSLDFFAIRWRHKSCGEKLRGENNFSVKLPLKPPAH